MEPATSLQQQASALEPDPEQAALLSSAPKTSYLQDQGKQDQISNTGKWSDEELEVALCPPNGIKRYRFLDLTRILCVSLVAVDHGYGAYSAWNCVFTQDWVLQYLFLVCGVCFGMSNKPLYSYELRLATYAVIGISINLAAWVLTGADWKANFFGVIFQFWFVIGVMGNSILLTPLKWYLEGVRERNHEKIRKATSLPKDGGCKPDAEQRAIDSERQNRNSLTVALVIIGGGLLVFVVLFTVAIAPLFQIIAPICVNMSVAMGPSGAGWGLPTDPKEAVLFLRGVSTYIMLSLSNIYLAFVSPKVLENPSLTGWLVLANTYFLRIFFYRGADERPFHALDLMTLALTVYELGLLHRRKIGQYVARYWFLVGFACCLIWIPGTYGRLDEDPPKDLSTRARFNLIEAILVTCWLVAGERFVSNEIFTVDRMGFLNDWALLVFLVHKAIDIAAPSPFNWVILVGMAPACYFWRLHNQK